jgi:hypothetical protein
MKKRDAIEELIKKYGKRENEIDESLKSKMVEIWFGNPREVYYVPVKEVRKLFKKQAELELEEDLYGFHARI